MKRRQSLIAGCVDRSPDHFNSSLVGHHRTHQYITSTPHRTPCRPATRLPLGSFYRHRVLDHRHVRLRWRSCETCWLLVRSLHPWCNGSNSPADRCGYADIALVKCRIVSYDMSFRVVKELRFTAFASLCRHENYQHVEPALDLQMREEQAARLGRPRKECTYDLTRPPVLLSKGQSPEQTQAPKLWINGIVPRGQREAGFQGH